MTTSPSGDVEQARHEYGAALAELRKYPGSSHAQAAARRTWEAVHEAIRREVEANLEAERESVNFGGTPEQQKVYRAMHAFMFGGAAGSVVSDALEEFQREVEAPLLEAIANVLVKMQPVPSRPAYREIHGRHLRVLRSFLDRDTNGVEGRG